MTAEEFKSKVMPYHQAMYVAARMILGDDDDAADVVQETMITLWQRRQRMVGIDDLKAYSVAVAKHKAIDSLRRKVERAELSVLDKNTDDSQDQFRRLSESDELNKVKNLMNQLPENSRKVLELRAYADCSMEEIEEITGLSGSNVRVLLSRGRKKLKELYERLR